MFIKVTDANEDREIIVNTNHIVACAIVKEEQLAKKSKGLAGTVVITLSNSETKGLFIKETMEELAKLLSPGHCYIPFSHNLGYMRG